jgi:ABC-type lipoprotein release transport system permease subunit
MPDPRATNRAMFWRIIRRLFGANPGRLFVMLLALGAGAAVTAALLNLQVDAKRRLTTEFSIFGPNALILPRGDAATFTEATFDQLTKNGMLPNAQANLSLICSISSQSTSQRPVRAVVTGTRSLDPIDAPKRRTAPSSESEPYDSRQICFAGGRLASKMNLKVGDNIVLRAEGHEEPCIINFIWSRGDAGDDQITSSLGVAQRLAGMPGRVSIIQLDLRGKPAEQEAYLASLQHRFPDLEVRLLREFTEAQAKIYDRISGLLTMTVGIVLLLTALCVMAAMTNVAMERKMDVGLMKAIGGSMRRVLRLFLAEAALLGLAGGVIGAAAGIFLSIGLGKAVFGVAARPRLIVYPVAVALTVIVAILSAFPLRRLASIRPASVFRGEA